MSEAEEVNGFVREKLFNERTGNIRESIEKLDDTIKEVLGLFREGQAEQDEKIETNCEQVAAICAQLDIEAEGENTQHKDTSLRLARTAIIISIITGASTLGLGILGVILKVVGVI